MKPSLHITILSIALATPVIAQQPTVFATGLQNPSKIIFTPGGNLMVTECGTATTSGRVSLVNTSGTRTTLISGLPSGPAAPGYSPDGENGLAISGRTLYIAIGEGDTHVNGPTSGTILPNPAGPSSPLFSSIISATFSTDIDKLSGPFALTEANQYTIFSGLPVTLTDPAGDTATMRLVTYFRDLPDPHTIYRNSHPYGLAILPSMPRVIFMADAGMNQVVQVDRTGGRSTAVAQFPNTPDSLPTGPPTSEAVPNSIQPYGNHLLVSLLSGVPFVPGASRIVELNPATGTYTNIIPNQTSAIDVAFQPISDGSTQFYVLEYSLTLAAELAGGAPGPGQLVMYSTKGTSSVLAKTLTSPSSMALNTTTGNLYITDLSEGTILVVPTH
jgi:hypothetical protein